MTAPSRPTERFGDRLNDQLWARWEQIDIDRGRAGVLGLYYCFACHHRHETSSAVGRRHERHGNPAIVRGAKKEVLAFRTADIAP